MAQSPTAVRTVLVALVASTIALTPLTGCRQGGMRTADRALAALPDSLRSAMNSYLSQLEGFTTALGGISTPDAAAAAAPDLQQRLGTLDQLADVLQGASPDAKKNFRAAFGRQLTDATRDFSAQASRLTADPALAEVLKPLLDRVPQLSF